MREHEDACGTCSTRTLEKNVEKAGPPEGKKGESREESASRLEAENCQASRLEYFLDEKKDYPTKDLKADFFLYEVGQKQR